MRQPRRPTLRRQAVTILLLAAAGAAGTGAASQTTGAEGQITGVISAPGLARLALALPDFRLSPLVSAAMREASLEIHESVVTDLEYTGYFDVLPRDRYAEVPEDASHVPFQRWAATGAVALMLGAVSPESDRLSVEGLLFDTRGEQLILGKRYRGEVSAARQIAHRLSNEIVLHFTGRQGIALSRLVFEGRVGRAKEIFMMDYDGHGVRQVTRNGSLNVSPAISPDGAKIAFVSYKSGSPRLYVLSQDGPMTDVSPPGVDLCAAPDWSPDGRALAFSAAREGDSDIYVHSFDAGSSRRITFTPGSDTSPSWSPSGREIAFTSDRTGRPQVYVMDAEGANVRRLTYDGSYNDQAAWSPQGDRIAFAGWVNDHFDVFVMESATGAVQRITDAAGYNENPRWSADGRHIVFTSNRLGQYQIFTMDDTGARPARLSTPFEASAPDWSR